MGRAPCCDKAAVKKGPWSPEEDAKLRAFIEENGTGGNWIALPHKIGLKRCGKSCRLRWLNYLRPNIKHGDFSEEEDFLVCSLYISIGSRWSIIAAQLPGRTDNDVKNYWNTKLKKKLLGKKRDHRQRHHEETDTGMTISKHEIASSQQSMAASALERMQLHMKLQSLCHPFPSMDYSSVAAATPSPLLTTAATGVTAGAAGPSYHHKNLPQQIINPDTMRDDLMSASSATSRLGLGFHSSSSTVSSEGIRVNSGLMFDGSINWEESLDSWGSGDEISSSSGVWDLSAVFQATEQNSMLQDWQHKK